MGSIDDETPSISQEAADLFGETVVFDPSGEDREIQAIVRRGGFDQNSALGAESSEPIFEVIVINSATLGIASTENVLNKTMQVAERKGEQRGNYTIVGVTVMNAGRMVLVVR